MKMYAGFYKDLKKNRLSASGGAATALSETVIKMGGIVYGAVYEDDYYSARYDYTDNLNDLDKFKGSKYALVNKIVVRNGVRIGLYQDVAKMLENGTPVLLIGLGCDIGNMYHFLEARHMDSRNLFTVELLCHGCTYPEVHRDYIAAMEEEYQSKIIGFNLRYKDENWEPTYIYIKFENGIEMKRRFDYSEYAYAFYHYKVKSCYDCLYKGIGNHRAHLAIGDYWGCCEGMKSYNPTGVSLILVQDERGYELIDKIDRTEYRLIDIEDESFPLKNQPAYFTAHNRGEDWELFDKGIRQEGLMLFVHRIWRKNVPERFINKKFKKIVVWGAGQVFLQNFEDIESVCDIAYVCDSNEAKWGKKVRGKEVKAPDCLSLESNIFVIITANNVTVKCAIVNSLLDKGIMDFDFFENWITYAKAGEME